MLDAAFESGGHVTALFGRSGAGKTTLCHRLLAEFQDSVGFSVSYTTRKPRPGEVDGKDYHFIDQPTFEAMVAKGDFAEWAHVHGNNYGTGRAWVQNMLSQGRDVLFDIDFQGGRQLKAQYGSDAIMIFILPPGLDVLEQRLRRRQSESEEAIELRLHNSLRELEHYLFYDYLIVNAGLDQAYDELRAVYLATRYAVLRRAPLVEALIREAKARR